MSKTRTPLTLLNGSRTMCLRRNVTFHRAALRWPARSSETQLPSKNCSAVLASNSRPCSRGRRSCTGTPRRAWTRWRQVAVVVFLCSTLLHSFTVYGGRVEHAGSSCRIPAVSGCNVSPIALFLYDFNSTVLGSAEEEGEYEEEVPEETE